MAQRRSYGISAERELADRERGATLRTATDMRADSLRDMEWLMAGRASTAFKLRELTTAWTEDQGITLVGCGTLETYRRPSYTLISSARCVARR